MAEEDDNVERKSSSLGILSEILSSFTSIGSSNSAPESKDSNEVEQTDTKHAEEQQEGWALTGAENTADVDSRTVTEDDSNVERRQSSLERITDFFSSFTSSGSSENSNELSISQSKADSGAQQLQESSDFSDDNAADSGEIAEDSLIQERTQSSLEKISGFLSSFTSLGNSSTDTPTADDEQTDEDTDTADTADTADTVRQQDENIENGEEVLEDGEVEEPAEGRLRKSSSRIFTAPEEIDKKDLDYVTLVSS